MTPATDNTAPDLWRCFIATPLADRITRHHHQCAQQTALTLFRDTAATVPAYQQFPAGHNVAVDLVRNGENFQQLLRLNSEFAHYVAEHDQTPVITLLPNGDPEYFPGGVKHRYTRRP